MLNEISILKVVMYARGIHASSNLVTIVIFTRDSYIVQIKAYDHNQKNTMRLSYGKKSKEILRETMTQKMIKIERKLSVPKINIMLLMMNLGIVL